MPLVNGANSSLPHVKRSEEATKKLRKAFKRLEKVLGANFMSQIFEPLSMISYMCQPFRTTPKILNSLI